MDTGEGGNCQSEYSDSGSVTSVVEEESTASTAASPSKMDLL